MIAAVEEQQARADRRQRIAAAGIRLIAASGVRGLTHRAVDGELGLPTGSTSYYARTRRDLVQLVVQRLAERTTLDLARLPVPEASTIPECAALLATGLEILMQRPEEQVARIALHLEYRDDPEMQRALAGDPPLRPSLEAAARAVLHSLGLAADHAAALVDLMDALLVSQVVRGARLHTEAVFTAYLKGLAEEERP